MRILVVSLLLMTSWAYRSMNQTSSESPAPTTLIRAARLLDPRTGNVLSPAAVLTSSGDDRIVLLRQPLSHELWLLCQLTLIHINAALRQDRAFGRPENDAAIP